MCIVIYATVPSCSDLECIRDSPLRLVPTADAVIAPRLQPNEQLCAIEGVPLCGGGGHCGTVLGRAVLADHDANERFVKQIGKLKKRGWSEHKIEMWLEQKQRTRQPAHMNRDIDELGLWNELLRAALENARLRFVGLMVFNAGDEQEVPIRCEMASRTSCDLTKVEMGVLYRIARLRGSESVCR
jgi:hypothetical protein